MAGLAQYSEFFSNPLFSETIREIPVKKDHIGARFLPIEETYETKFHESVVTHQADMANIVSLDAEIPLTDRDPMRHVSGEIADIAQAYIVTKEEMAAVMDKGNSGKKKIAEKQLLGKARQIKENVDARIEWMRWQALGNDGITYAKNGIYVTQPFGINMKKVAGIRWNDVGATILADYESWVQEYLDNNGVLPSTYVTSIKAIRTWLANGDARKQITGLSDKLVTISELNAFLEDRQMPRIEAFDSSVTYRDVNNQGQRVTQRLLAENKGIFLREGGEIGSQLLGPTVENGMNPGIFGRTIREERPMRDIIEVVASSFPKITSPDLVGITTILA
ncbi:major capsid protein [Domibacillus indicus]|uniref:major capsid protein n=1 Tax=Domibacillus indicus TaxID=1437523 RepID=UPI002041CAC2|nr:major capsid protein [Domibacillus indicus]MCM3789430.1 major capsid protein [Domibacillus indicus]